MRPLPPVAARQWGVFRTDQALSAGWTRHALLHAVRHGDLEQVRPRAYAVPEAGTGERHRDASALLRRRAAAVGLTHTGVAVSHAAATALVDLPLLITPAHPCVTAEPGVRGRVRHAHLHRAQLPRWQVARVGELLLTRPARTVLDVARESGVDAAIGAADAALRRGIVRPGEFEAVLASCAGWPGIRSATTLVASVDASAESVLESLSRLRLVNAALPKPRMQVDIRVEGRFAGRVDFYWDEFGVVGEADGMAKYDVGPTALREEKRRQDRLEDAGLIVVRWTWTDLRNFDTVVRRLHRAFARAARPDRGARRWQVDPSNSVRSVS